MVSRWSYGLTCSPHLHRVLSRECWRATLPFASACTMATSYWCRWGSDRSSFTSRESWTGPEVGHLTSRLSVHFVAFSSSKKHFAPLESFSSSHPHTPDCPSVPLGGLHPIMCNVRVWFVKHVFSVLCLVQRCRGQEMSCRGLPPLWTFTMSWKQCLWSHLLVPEHSFITVTLLSM